MLLGVDVGGTFTDAVLFDGEQLHTAKLPTTPGDQSQAVIAAGASQFLPKPASPDDLLAAVNALASDIE